MCLRHIAQGAGPPNAKVKRQELEVADELPGGLWEAVGMEGPASQQPTSVCCDDEEAYVEELEQEDLPLWIRQAAAERKAAAEKEEDTECEEEPEEELPLWIRQAAEARRAAAEKEEEELEQQLAMYDDMEKMEEAEVGKEECARSGSDDCLEVSHDCCPSTNAEEEARESRKAKQQVCEPADLESVVQLANAKLVCPMG